LSSSALRPWDLEQIANRLLEEPIPDGADPEKEIGARVTQWIEKSGYSSLRPRRSRRGKLIFVGALASGSDEEGKHNGEELLTLIRLDEASSIQREHDQAKDTVDTAIASATPKNREVLEDAVSVVATGDSPGDIARETNHARAQVARAIDQARQAIANPRRIKRPKHELRREVPPYNPRCVSQDRIMQIHQGATLPIGREKRTTDKRTRELPSLKGIRELPKPRGAAHLEHQQFGAGVILRERITDSGECLDVEFEDGTRRTVLKASVKLEP
jgi:hypothetical protein